MSETPVMKPCPFPVCSSPWQELICHTWDATGCHVRCTGCGARGPTRADADDAVAVWNALSDLLPLAEPVWGDRDYAEED